MSTLNTFLASTSTSTSLTFMQGSTLPFDVLFNILSVCEETPEQPLETLLLVCRLWKETALECKHIWSTFNLDFKDRSTVLRWSRQIPRRLERSGASTPISFSLKLRRGYSNCKRDGCPRFDFPGYYWICECHRTVHQNVETILRALLGPDGSLCTRWREVEIMGDRSPVPALIDFFSYPTSQVTSLTLHSVQYQPKDPIFLPSTPSLKNVQIVKCGLPNLPNLINATEIHFSEQYDRAADNMNTTSPFFSRADQVRRLRLNVGGYMWQPYEVPGHLPFLEHLSLGGDRIPNNMRHVQAPLLRELRVCFWHFNDIDDSTYYDNDEEEHRRTIIHLVKCKGIPFSQVETLTIEFRECDEVMLHEDYWNGYVTLLRLCNNVKKIYGDRRSTIFILKLLKEDCVRVGTLASRKVIISDGLVSREIKSGVEERLDDIEVFAAELGCSEMKDDRREFLKQIHDLFRGR